MITIAFSTKEALNECQLSIHIIIYALPYFHRSEPTHPTPQESCPLQGTNTLSSFKFPS